MEEVDEVLSMIVASIQTLRKAQIASHKS
jgi:hypothetical protein